MRATPTSLLLACSLALVAVSCSDDSDSAGPVDTDSADTGSVDNGENESTETTESETEAESSSDDGGAIDVIGRPEFVSGGAVLVHYEGATDEPEFVVDGVTLETEARGDGYHVVSGLPEGPVTLSAGTASVEIVNHPITGPVFSGPHQQPFYCVLEGSGLTPTGDDDCSAETKVEYGYIDDEGTFVPTTQDETPADALIVRREQGTINRGIYTIAVADPSFGTEPIEPGRDLIYQFGGGCGTGHTQASGLVAGSSVLDVEALAAGYILATSTLNVYQAHCNDVLSAETMMMVKDRVNETIGPVGTTVGRGGSGGAIQQYSIVQNYPGLLDAVSASVSFPDAISVAPGTTDCGLLRAFYASEVGGAFTPEQQLAVNGHGSTQACAAWAATFLPGVNASQGCDAAVPADAIYDAETNPDGARCTLQDSAANLFGVDEQGRGRRPLDNIGVQYGLRALDDGVISVDQFLDLNEAIGGYDIDGNIVGDRHRADPDLLETAYATGRVLHGGSLLDVPIIDVDLYSDLGFDIHDRVRLFTIRARMEAENGAPTENRVIWTRGGAGLIAVVSGADPGSITDEEPGTVPSGLDAVDLLVEWATTGERPEGVADDCIIDGERIVGDDAFEAGRPCADAYPYHGDPRIVAGAPLRNDILKCETVPVDADAYTVTFDEAQQARLAEVFSEGVCDWSVPGVGQVPLAGTWLRFDEAP